MKSLSDTDIKQKFISIWHMGLIIGISVVYLASVALAYFVFGKTIAVIWAAFYSLLLTRTYLVIRKLLNGISK